MINDILGALWFFLPAGIANMTPVIAAKIPVVSELDYPIDAHKTWRGKRIFGDHKTVRGFITGFLSAVLVVAIQFFAYVNFAYIREISYINYDSFNLLLLAAALSLGALGGDAVKSFFKRQLNRPPGKSWFPFDQLDYIVGGLLAAGFLVDLTGKQILTVAVVWFIVHPLSTYIAWTLKLKDKPI